MSSFDVIISDRAVFQKFEMYQTLKIMSRWSGDHVHKASCSRILTLVIVMHHVGMDFDGKKDCLALAGGVLRH